MACGPVMESDMETREQMEARHAAERAALEARGRDPWKDAIDAFFESGSWCATEEQVKRALLAAAPLMPVQQSACAADAWPGEAELERFKEECWEINPYIAMGNIARRLRAHMTAAGADQ